MMIFVSLRILISFIIIIVAKIIYIFLLLLFFVCVVKLLSDFIFQICFSMNVRSVLNKADIPYVRCAWGKLFPYLNGKV